MSSLIFDQYEERLHRLERDPSTIYGFRRAADIFDQYLRVRKLPAEQVTTDDLEDFLYRLDRAPSTKQLYLTHIGAAYRYAHRRGVIPKDPTVDVLTPRQPDSKRVVIPNEELREMKARLVSDNEWLLWHLLVYTGMRRHEVTKLKWEDVSFREATIYVLGKGGKERFIPIHPALAEVLVEHGDRGRTWVLQGRRLGGQERPLSKNGFHALVARITAGRWTAHAFRKTVTSSLHNNGVDGDVIDEIMGWSRRGIRRRYYQTTASPTLQRAILKLYEEDPL